MFETDGVIDNARRLGTDVVGPQLQRIAGRHPSVGDVRGIGAFWAVELVRDRESRRPLVPFNAAGPAAAPMTELAAACMGLGLYPFVHFNRLHIAPPCTATADEVTEGLTLLDQALHVADSHCE